MKSAEEQYLELARHVLNTGNKVDNDRTGTGMLESFGHQIKFDLQDGFPALTTKRVFFKGAVTELLWYLRGEGDVEYLHKHGVTIWDEWADDEGNLGPVYGVQMRSWIGSKGQVYDQLAEFEDRLINEPESRRHIISLWAVHELSEMALPPCPVLMQGNVRDGKLNLSVYQRSADIFLGLPFDIMAFSIFTHIMAERVGLEAGEVTYTIGSAHIYYNHIPQIKEQLKRKPRPMPQLGFVPRADYKDFEPTDFLLVGYDPHPPIKGEISK
ncbi:thymidylate synthase [Enterococcus faecalis]|nr:thymidylate synthase [Enterococcus faecalis]